MLRVGGNTFVPFTVTDQFPDMSSKGMVTLQKPAVPFVSVMLKMSVLVAGSKLRFVMVELLTVSTLYAAPFQVPTLNVWNGLMSEYLSVLFACARAPSGEALRDQLCLLVSKRCRS
jgi:hypothetical protein